jgi:hypothetical protein
MPTDLHERISTELAVMERFAASYQHYFRDLITELNGAPNPAAAQRSLRLCIEAVNMMLDNHRTLAMALRGLATQVPLRRAA